MHARTTFGGRWLVAAVIITFTWTIAIRGEDRSVEKALPPELRVDTTIALIDHPAFSPIYFSRKSTNFPPISTFIPDVKDVWSLPKPPLTNYEAFVLVRCDAAAHEANGDEGYTDMEVAHHFPICVRSDGTTNYDHIKLFRGYLEQETKEYLAERAKPRETDPHRAIEAAVHHFGPRESAMVVQYQIMRKENRILPPEPADWRPSKELVELLRIGPQNRGFPMTPGHIRFKLIAAQVSYLRGDNPKAALEELRTMNPNISDRDAAFLLRTSTELLIPPIEYSVYPPINK